MNSPETLEMGQHLTFHGDGVKDIAFDVYANTCLDNNRIAGRYIIHFIHVSISEEKKKE